MFTPEELEVLRVALALYAEYATPRNIPLVTMYDIAIKLNKTEVVND